MKITKLEYQKKDPNRVNIYIDERFAVGLEVNDLVRLGLYKGQEITSEQLQKIISESEFGKLFNSALNFLSFRPRSEWEVRQMLARKIKNLKLETGEEKITQVIEKLKKIKQVDDQTFARWWIDQRSTFRTKGDRAIKIELLRKGVDRKVIEEIFTGLEPVISEDARATTALSKKLKSWDIKKIGHQKFKEKAMRFLVGRGFSYDTAISIIEKLVPKE